ncbi:hypothetical protein [Nocardia amamiensis]|uniref:hypothetical protein n=1 Tax=Nocardia amamiensis TaxID=404578 RepID=UPI00082F49CF|nr:hypothetical protein [Nocardia amamiensis]
MRTTVDVPPELMRAAKIAATERGVSLKELFIKALTHEIGAGVRSPKRGRINLPLIGTTDAQPRVDVTNADIEAAFEADDVEKYAQ